MAVIDHFWPAEKNVGGIHRTGRYVLAPALAALGIAILIGWLSVAPRPTGVVVGIALVLAGVVSYIEARSQKCPGYAVMGIDTCDLPAARSGAGDEEAA